MNAIIFHVKMAACVSIMTGRLLVFAKMDGKVLNVKMVWLFPISLKLQTIHCLTCISIENTILQIPIFTDTNECLTFPCQNNGTCINNPGSYKCDCNNGWTGKDCIEGTCKHVLFCQDFGYTINNHAFNVHVY